MARIYRRTVQKDLHDPDNHDGVITHLEPDILEYEVKWALGSITTNKASGGDGTPVELFQILKDDAVKVLHSICQQIWKTQQWPQDWKRSVFIPIPKKGNAKKCSNYHTIASISHSSKVKVKSSIVSNSLWSRGLYPIRLLRLWDFPGKNTGVGCHFLLQGIFPTQGQNPCLLPCRQMLYRLSHQGSLLACEMNAIVW